MRAYFTWRFWVEGVAAIAANVLLAVTLVWPDWIELTFGVDPDHGSGAVEWLIVLVSFVVLLSASILAGREWRGAIRGSSPTTSPWGTTSSDLS